MQALAAALHSACCTSKPPPSTLPTPTPGVQVTSSAKRKLKPGSTHVHQTPDGSFLDLQRNAAELLGTHCGMAVPEVGGGLGCSAAPAGHSTMQPPPSSAWLCRSFDNRAWSRGLLRAAWRPHAAIAALPGVRAGQSRGWFHACGPPQLAPALIAPSPAPPGACVQVGSVADYLERGPGFVFLAHPALGPLWRVVGQKIRGGSLAPRSEVQLEVAEACLRDVHVAGSLRVLADAPLGHTEERAAPAGGAAADGRRRMSSLLEALLAPGANSSLGGLNGVEPLGGGSAGGAAVVEAGDDGTWSSYSQPCTLAEAPAACAPRGAERRLAYSQRCGRVRLHNVRVANAGVDWAHPDNVWWRHSLVRREACTILLRGMSGEQGLGSPRGAGRSGVGRAALSAIRLQHNLLCRLAVLAAQPHFAACLWAAPWTAPFCRPPRAAYPHLPAEFEARDVTLPGDLTFEVPDGCRMRVTAGPDGELRTRLEPLAGPSWRWVYRMGPVGEVELSLLELGGSREDADGADGGSGADGFALGL